MKKYLKYPIYITIIIASALLLTGCTPSEEEISQYNTLITEATTLFEAKEYSTAVEKYNEATSVIPSNKEAYLGLVETFLLKNRVEDAKEIIDKSANKLNANDRSQLYLLVGNAYFNNGDYDNAKTTYDLAKGISENGEIANLGYAKVALKQGDMQTAETYLSKNYDGENLVEAKLLLSYVQSLDNIEEAKSTIGEISPTENWTLEYSEWNGVLGSMSEDTLYNATKLSRVYINNDYPYLAILKLEPLQEEMAEYIDGLYFLGKAYYDQGDYQKSIDTLANATALSDISQYVYWTVARDYYFTNDVISSLEYYDRAITYAGDEAEEKLFQEYLDTLLDDNQTTKADEVLTKAENIFENIEWVNLYNLKLALALEQPEKINYYIEQTNSNNLEGSFKEEYLYIKTSFYIENGDTDDALRTLDTFYNFDQFSPRYAYLMGQLKFQEGKLDEARDYLKKSIEYDLERIVTDYAQKLLARID